MSRILLLLLVAFLSISARMPTNSISTEQDNTCSPKYIITQKESHRVNGKSHSGKVRIIYRDYEELNEKNEIEIAEKNLDEKKAAESRSMVPKGGQIYVLIYRKTREEVVIEPFEYIIKKNGREISRQSGGMWVWLASYSPGLPSHNGKDGEYWTNVDMVQLEDPIKRGEKINIKVIDPKGGSDNFVLYVTP